MPAPGGRRLMAKGLLILWVLLIGSAAAHAAPSQSVYLEDLTWPELRADIAAGKTTILVPIGGTEQNGPQMALGKHNVRVHVLSAKIAHALGNALVAPVIAYVPEGDIDHPQGHLKFPGTITIPVARVRADPRICGQELPASPASATSSFWAITAAIRRPTRRWRSVSTGNGRRPRSAPGR